MCTKTILDDFGKTFKINMINLQKPLLNGSTHW